MEKTIYLGPEWIKQKVSIRKNIYVRHIFNKNYEYIGDTENEEYEEKTDFIQPTMSSDGIITYYFPSYTLCFFDNLNSWFY